MSASAEIGTGTTEFATLAPEQELTVIAGPQGGHHFFVHARMSGMLPGDPTMPGIPKDPRTVFAAYSEDGEQVDARYPPYRIGYQPAPDGRYELPGGRLLILDPEDDTLPDRLYGHRVRLTLEIEDSAGHQATDERWVVAVEQQQPPPADAGPTDAGPPDGGL